MIVRRAAEFDMIVCSGGDGTLDEVVTGLMNSGEKKPVGYIPAGSTNDFANSIGIPKPMEQAAKLVVEGEPLHAISDGLMTAILSMWQHLDCLPMYPIRHRRI